MLAFLVVVVLIPVLLFPVPPLLDYPNHLARLWLLQGGVDTPLLDRIYAEDWHGIGTNIGIDLIAKALWFVPTFTLGRILLALAMVLPPLGAIALNLSRFRRLGPWQLLFLYFCFTETVLSGFLNFHLGLGLALCAAAADGFVGGAWKQRAFRLGAAAVLLVIHPFALLFYCLLLAGILFGAALPDWTPAHLRPRLLRAAEAGICLVPLAVFLATHALPGDPRTTPHAIYNPPLLAAGTLLFPFRSYQLLVDLAFGFPILVLVFTAIAARRIKIHAGLLAVALLFAAGSPFMPSATYESGWLDHRLPIMAVLTALAATDICFGKRRRILLAAGIAGLVVLRTVWIGLNWNTGAAILDSIRRATADLPPGVTVLSMQHLELNGAPMPFYGHYPALLIPWRHVFVPSLFAEPGKQPVRARAPYDRISVPQGGGLPSVHGLWDATLLYGPYQGWRQRFDYVLVLNAEEPDVHGTFVPPPELKLMRDSGFAQLYRITEPRPRR